MKGIFVLTAYHQIYDEETVRNIGKLIELDPTHYTAQSILEHPDALEDCDIIFSGWGAPKMEEEFLRLAPKLKIVFYGAGSVHGMVSNAFWKRGIRCVSAWGANAIPVSEYTLGMILLALKRALPSGREYMSSKGSRRDSTPFAGGFHSTVGIVSTGMIGRRVIDLLKSFEVNVIAYDPYLSEQKATNLGVRKVTLEELFATSDVVSVHTPLLPQTVGMITGEHIASMKQGATLINSARGAVIREPEMIEVLQRRPDLYAVLDVTAPEPPTSDSPLWEMPNVLLTPHIAGSMGAECARHGHTMLEECRRYLAGEPMQYEVDEEFVKTMA